MALSWQVALISLIDKEFFFENANAVYLNMKQLIFKEVY